MLTALGYEVHHARLSGHQPLLQSDPYRSAVVHRLHQILDTESYDLFIPMFEEVFFLSEHAWFQDATLLAEPWVYPVLHDKWWATTFNRTRGLPHVRTVLGSRANLAPQRLCPPLFVKHRDSRGGYGTTVFFELRHAQTFLKSVDPGDYVLQGYVPGDLWILQGVFRNGALIDYEILLKQSLWQDQKTVRYLPYHRSAHHPQAVGLLAQVGDLTCFSGMLEFECIDQDGELLILEYNPRFSADFLHSVVTGSSFAENTVRAYAGQSPISHRSALGLSRNESIRHRYLKRQWGTRPGALFDPRWLVRWARMEFEIQESKKNSPYNSFSPAPAAIFELGRSWMEKTAAPENDRSVAQPETYFYPTNAEEALGRRPLETTRSLEAPTCPRRWPRARPQGLSMDQNSDGEAVGQAIER